MWNWDKTWEADPPSGVVSVRTELKPWTQVGVKKGNTQAKTLSARTRKPSVISVLSSCSRLPSPVFPAQPFVDEAPRVLDLMLLSPFTRPRIQLVFRTPQAQRVLSPCWPGLDASFPSARLHSPTTASCSTFSSRATISSSPNLLSAERRHARFSEKIKATRSELP